MGDHGLLKRAMSGELRGNVGRGEMRKNGRTAWQRIVGYLASWETRAPPHQALGFGTAQYTKGAVGVWTRGRGKRIRRAKTGRWRERRKKRTKLSLHLG